MKNASWKTTASGVVAIIAALAGAAGLLLDGKPDTNPDYTSLIAAITAGVGLIMARDNDKSSEEVSAK